MSLFSFLRKNKQESAAGDSAFYSRAEEESATGRRARRKQGKSARAEEALDPMLPEKKRARRRLIGAVALVLAAVIGLPMIFDAEPRSAPDDITIQIPAKDKPAAPPAVAPERPGASSSRVAASAALDPKEEVLPAASRPAAHAPEAVAAAAPEPHAKPAQEPKSASDAGEKTAAAKAVAEKTGHDAHAAGAEPKPIAEADDAARARALLNGKPDPKAAEKKSEKFVIQVAALATKEKVNELQLRLKDAGIKSYTQKVATASGDRTRIRVGPFASREDAEKMRTKIVKLGLNGTLVPVESGRS